jgi:hypothetical protein
MLGRFPISGYCVVSRHASELHYSETCEPCYFIGRFRHVAAIAYRSRSRSWRCRLAGRRTLLSHTRMSAMMRMREDHICKYVTLFRGLMPYDILR